MDYYLIDFNKENNYTFDNVIIGKKIICSSTENIFKYYIYYSDDNKNSPKIIYIKVPKIRLMYKLGQNNYKQERIVLYPNYDLLQNFIDYIKELEKNIYECIKNKYPNIELSSILIKNNINNNYSIKLNSDDKIKLTSTQKQSINIKDFKINNEIELVIKINYLWIKDNKFGINVSIYQIKYYASLEELNINLLDNEIDEQPPIIIPPPIKNIPPLVKNIPPPPPIFSKLVPTVDALLNAKSKLKKT